MSKCANCQREHPDVGQHPNHPVEIGTWTPFIWVGATVILIIILLVIGEK